MRKIIFKVCHHCTKRFISCHATCEDYLKEKAMHEELKRLANLDKDARAYDYEAAIKRNNKLVLAKKKHVTVRRNYH